MALKKVLICPWFGPMPEWMPLYWEHAADKGFDWLVEDDAEAFKDLVRERLSIEAPIVEGEAKVHDYRPALGFLYEDEIRGYDFWGHTDFDCVYGRLDHFYTDEYLADLDIYSDNNSYVAGPLSLYRNAPEVNRLFLDSPVWREKMTEPGTNGWVEREYTQALRSSGLRFRLELFHRHLDPAVIHFDENRLMEGKREISFFHFRYTKQWPL